MDTLRLLSRGSGSRMIKLASNQTRSLPSGGGEEIQQNQISKKRKREDIDIDDTTHRALTDSEILQIQKQHKIRITDLRTLHSDQKSESRKAQKEASRLFPQPLQSFSHLKDYNVSKSVMANLTDQGYQEPTEVQLATIPLLLKCGFDEPDLLTVAPTGSGKTLAFMIPVVNKIFKRHRETTSESARHVNTIILAPTKELVSQIVNEGRKICLNTGVKVTAMRKGMRLHGDIEVVEASSEEESENETSITATIVKSDILVATPLTLVHAITNASTSEILALPDVTTLILDEADVLLDVLFREQTLSIWSACTSVDLRASLWSATIGSNIEELAISTITNRQEELKISPCPPLLRTIIGLKDTSLPNIEHKLIYASTEPGKLMGLRQLLHPAPSHSSSTTTTTSLRPPFLIFTQTITRAIALHSELQYDIPAASGGSSRIAVLHSNLSSTARSSIMTSFRTGKIWILITTDLLSRGVDFHGLNGVVNYDIPTTPASYVHRAGRTNRGTRTGGICVTFYTRDDVRYLKPIANVISASSTPSNAPFLPAWLIPALPDLSKNKRKDLKQHGVEVRRNIRDGEDRSSKREKNKNRIGTQSGYERRAEERKREMKEGSRRRKARDANAESADEEVFGGFD